MGGKAESSAKALVCRGGKCRKAGSDELVKALTRALDGSGSVVGVTGCLGRCKKGVAALLWPEGACVSRLRPNHAEALAEHLLEGGRLPKALKVADGKKVRKTAKKRARASAA